MRSGFTAKRVCYGIVHSGNKGLNFCAWRLRMISFNLPAPCDTGITHCSRGLPSFLHCCPYPPLPPRAVRVRHVSWSTWGISSSLGHLGLEVDACGSSLPCFHGSLGKTDLGTLEIGGLSLLEHMGQTATPSFFLED